ncbi:MAG: UbiE/COQ5 methyltransferase [Planctomycetaceae bacterium]|nr:UbiE/COQ5 methyltransferase [Planctomycetaceae bacterium]
MLQRVLEPEVMDSLEEAQDYDSMDHAEVNRRFVDHLLECRSSSELESGRPVLVLDVGTGTAQIPIELAGRGVAVRITAIDLAAEMLKLGQINVERAGLTDRIALELVDAKSLPYADGCFDWVISNSIIHHIPKPLFSLGEMLRVLAPGGLLFVRDLLRPVDLPTLIDLVQTYAGTANAHQRQMFDDSLHAALSLDEIQEMLTTLGYPPSWVSQTTDRHWTIRGRKRQRS